MCYLLKTYREDLVLLSVRVSIKKKNQLSGKYLLQGTESGKVQVTEIGEIKSRLCFSKLLLEIFLNTSNNSVA